MSIGGGHDPIWHPRGTELFYRSATDMQAVPVSLQPTFKAGAPRSLFHGQYVNTGTDSGYTAHGDRFVLIQEPTQTATAQIDVVLNWFEELKQRVKPRP